MDERGGSLWAGSVQKLARMLVARVSQAVRVQWCWLLAVWTLCFPVCRSFGGTGKVKNKFITRIKKKNRVTVSFL